VMSLPVFKSKKRLRVLCLGAHCDDIEIGCGATLLKLIEENPPASVTWVVFSSDEVRELEARKSAKFILGDSVSSELMILNHHNGYFPYVGAEIKDDFEQLKNKIEPDIIFTHYGKDHHQDHRVVSELTWNTFRNHWILEYEIPKYDGGLGSPNLFAPVQAKYVRRKSEILMDCYESQVNRPWFSRSTFDALMRLRGIECNSKSGYAEAFYVRKTIIE